MGREGTEGSDFHCARTGGWLEFSCKDAVQVHAAQCPCVSACQKKAEEQKDGQHFQWQTCNRTSHPLNVSGEKQEAVGEDPHGCAHCTC